MLRNDMKTWYLYSQSSQGYLSCSFLISFVLSSAKIGKSLLQEPYLNPNSEIDLLPSDY